MKHTPEPWHLEANFRSDPKQPVDTYWVKKGMRRAPIAMLTRDRVPIAEFEANARLIQLAPEMIRVIRALKEDWFDWLYHPSVFDGSSGDEGSERVVEIRNMLIDIIQRAEG